MTTAHPSERKNTPKHVAFIADGNRTWAKEHGLPSIQGHLQGAHNTITIIKYMFANTNVDVVTGWFLSTENLTNRSQEELDFIFAGYKIIGDELHEFLAENRVNFSRVGNPLGIPQHTLDYLENESKSCFFPDSEKRVILALNYGGRNEIIRGIQSLSSEEIKNLTEETFSEHLDFGKYPPVDLVIRSKGNTAHRTSGFMSRRIGYAELYFTPVYYPALSGENIEEALSWYDSIAEARNFGK